MAIQEMVEGLSKITRLEYLCGTCQFGKQSRVSFPMNRKWKATETLQLVHNDLGGPMKTLFLGGNKYHLVFIDEISKYCWIYFLKVKSDALMNFVKFRSLVENQGNTIMKTLKSDNGKEFTTSEFEKLLSQLGITHQLTATYSPQQNGISERKNRTLMEMARCLMF